MADIIVDRVYKSFDEKKVLEDVSLTIPAGSILCLMGESGCGKTTLIRIMAGLEKADSGEVGGIDHKRMSFVFQEDRLIPNATALANAILPLSGKEAKKAGLQALEEMGLRGEGAKRARELSGGMARRVAIIRAMLAEADIVFMDEPFKGLDEANRARAIRFVKARAKGKTLIVVTHDEDEAKFLHGKIIKMPSGQGKPSEKGEN